MTDTKADAVEREFNEWWKGPDPQTAGAELNLCGHHVERIARAAYCAAREGVEFGENVATRLTKMGYIKRLAEDRDKHKRESRDLRAEVKTKNCIIEQQQKQKLAAEDTLQRLNVVVADQSAEIERLGEKLGTMHADFYAMQDGSLVRDLRFVVETKQKTIARLKVRCTHLDDNLEEARDGLDDRDELSHQQEQTIAGLRTELSELITWVNDAIAESNRKAKEETQ